MIIKMPLQMCNKRIKTLDFLYGIPYFIFFKILFFIVWLIFKIFKKKNINNYD